MRNIFLPLVFILSFVIAAPALADDWTATKLRGLVLVNDATNAGPWTHLKRGDVVSDARAIRTMASGNVEFTRGNETIAFGPNSQGQIVDRTGKLYTTVVQQFGQVAIEAEAKQVQHFAVQTPFLVAVVKGTVFSVVTDKQTSKVSVSRGLVAVTDIATHKTLMVPAGQQVQEDASGTAPTVTGTPNTALTHPVVNGVVEDADSTGVSGVLDNTTSAAGDLLANTTSGLGATVSGVTGALGSATGGTIGSTVSSVGGTVGSTVSSVGSTVSSTVSSVGSTVSGTLKHLGL